MMEKNSNKKGKSNTSGKNFACHNLFLWGKPFHGTSKKSEDAIFSWIETELPPVFIF